MSKIKKLRKWKTKSIIIYSVTGISACFNMIFAIIYQYHFNILVLGFSIGIFMGLYLNNKLYKNYEKRIDELFNYMFSEYNYMITKDKNNQDRLE